ncbi:DNA mismatch repair endonuclease MutL [Xylanibacillus composti]|uniref:DNA mismatch repair protein MutL n=1 Tax=Xylanibacillus composti TaxID=1572762 RepID=A0A8J4M1M5_9BACL|nr:DNA mismatch repair endonuclease MutL [Xylanibacillus composti]MDT9725578.1 DNA mismatch repair endonuclease MutL [Xylanibacillus composti]GIQ67671.1 DNA mismatch repair protein MutL [Xylanibacillus composti]
MSRIRVLDEHIANQIAAGEVIERPASVMKELVENSVDAGATRIDITVKEGGLELIRVQDNGSGIAAEDCETAFQRHATSKISSGRDLFHIRSLGFRGEALPSIAAVAKVRCVTSAGGDGLGRLLVMEGGRVREYADIAADQGTDMTVTDLFYNTPARLKYMKTVQTELGHISDYIYRMALAHPGIAFSLRHNDNLMLQTNGDGDMRQTAAAIYGVSIAKALVPVEGESPDYRVTGYTAKPEVTRANRYGMTTIINGRYVRHFGLNQAVMRAYHTLLPINRFPVFMLRIEMDPSLVDVNVHPAKLEVRFSKETELLAWIEQEVRRALGAMSHIPKAVKREGKGTAAVQEQLAFPATERRKSGSEPTAWSAAAPSTNSEPARSDQASLPGRSMLGSSRPAKEQQRSAYTSGASGSSGAVRERQTALPNGQGEEIARRLYAPPQLPSARGQEERSDAASFHTQHPEKEAEARSAEQAQPAIQTDNASASEQAADSLPGLPKLYPVGQVLGTYIVAQNEEGMFLIDQHAAHERIHYELFYEKFGNPAEASQELLVPITLEFTPSEAAALKDRFYYLEQLGVYMEPFGGNTFKVTSHPHWLPKGMEQQVIEELCEWLLREKKAVDLAKFREASSILCACKASIKANQALSIQECETLLDRLRACNIPYTCPHGRPIVIRFSQYELEKMFKRTM